jgi:hypothetical protein
VAKAATQANRIDETPTTTRAVMRSRFVAGKVDRKMLRSLPVGTHDLLQAGIECTERVQIKRAYNKASAGAENLADMQISTGKKCRPAGRRAGRDRPNVVTAMYATATSCGINPKLHIT